MTFTFSILFDFLNEHESNGRKERKMSRRRKSRRNRKIWEKMWIGWIVRMQNVYDNPN